VTFATNGGSDAGSQARTARRPSRLHPVALPAARPLVRHGSLLRTTLAIDGTIIAIGVSTLAGAFLIDMSFGQKEGLLTVACLAILLLVVLRMYGLVKAARRGRERADAFASVGAALVTATNRREIYDAALGAAHRLTREGHEITLFELSDEALSPVAGTGTRSREARFLAGIDEATLAHLRAGEPVAADGSVLLPLAARGALLGLFEIAGPELEGQEYILLVALAQQISLALESAALSEGLHRSASEARLASLVRNSSELVLIVSADTTISYASPAVERVLGRSATDVTGRRLSELMMPGSVTPLNRAMVATPRLTDGASPLTSLQLARRDGSAVHAEALVTDLLSDPGVRGYIINIRDVTERMQFEDRLSHQAFHDLTTGLANRALFCSRTVHALERHDPSDAPVAVLFLDLDDFKSVNDGLGYVAGDQLLSAVGARLASSTRAADTIARIGGDEFAILIEASPDGDAVAAACRVHDLLEQPFSLEGREVFAHASIGIAFADSTTSGDLGAEQLLRNADLAMYLAKEDGKAQWRVFEAEMHQAVSDRLALKNDLELGIERGELTLHYQPIVRLATGIASGFEALLRWQHPTRGNVPPLDFIPLAEETGLIVQIGRRVLHAACRDGVRLNAAVARSDTIRVGVNLSARQLERPELIGEVRDALASSGLPPDLLVLELTESVMMRDVDLSTRRLRELKELGVLLALDDFGTGYSSLNYIQRFPVDILKIDKSFTDALGHGRNGRLTEAIVGLANALEMVQIAEGIEQPAQADRLLELGCELGQGYLFSPAVPIEQALGQLVAKPLRASAAA
jgi:diguanylate cyclase (GGDEF)-like protein/PAS domain S-box-containing protein